jgi:predicted nucleic acid-binding protein
VVDDRILIEYFDVLGRDKFKKYFSEYDRENIKAYLRNSSLHVTAEEVVSYLPDPGDVPFLEVALTMNVPLITGNLRHFPVSKRRSCVVLSPREFVDAINK